MLSIKKNRELRKGHLSLSIQQKLLRYKAKLKANSNVRSYIKENNQVLQLLYHDETTSVLTLAQKVTILFLMFLTNMMVDALLHEHRSLGIPTHKLGADFVGGVSDVFSYFVSRIFVMVVICLFFAVGFFPIYAALFMLFKRRAKLQRQGDLFMSLNVKERSKWVFTETEMRQEIVNLQNYTSCVSEATKKDSEVNEFADANAMVVEYKNKLAKIDEFNNSHNCLCVGLNRFMQWFAAERKRSAEEKVWLKKTKLDDRRIISEMKRAQKILFRFFVYERDYVSPRPSIDYNFSRKFDAAYFIAIVYAVMVTFYLIIFGLCNPTNSQENPDVYECREGDGGDRNKTWLLTFSFCTCLNLCIFDNLKLAMKAFLFGKLNLYLIEAIERLAGKTGISGIGGGSFKYEGESAWGDWENSQSPKRQGSGKNLARNPSQRGGVVYQSNPISTGTPQAPKNRKKLASSVRATHKKNSHTIPCNSLLVF